MKSSGFSSSLANDPKYIGQRAPSWSFAFPREEGKGETPIRASEARREGPAVLSALVAPFFIHPRQLLPHFPSVTADELTAARIRSGRPVNLPELSRARHIKVFHGQSDLVAIATRIAGTLFHPKIVFVAEPSIQIVKANKYRKSGSDVKFGFTSKGD
jgi:hypothetical protein